jgi:hypothetical protein
MFGAGCKGSNYRLTTLLSQTAAAGKKIPVASKD